MQYTGICSIQGYAVYSDMQYTVICSIQRYAAYSDMQYTVMNLPTHSECAMPQNAISYLYRNPRLICTFGIVKDKQWTQLIYRDNYTTPDSIQW